MVCKSWKDFSGFEQLSNKIRAQACVGKQEKLVEVHLALKSLKALLKQSSYIFWAQAKLQPLERSGLALCAGIFIIDPEFKLLIDTDLGSAEP